MKEYLACSLFEFWCI